MPRFLVVLFVWGCFAGCAPDGGGGKGGFVYKLDRGGEEFYLGATIHVLRKPDREVDPAYGSVMAGVERLVCEVDGSAEPGEVLALMAGSGKPSAELLEDSENGKLREVLTKFGLDPSLGERTPPQLVAAILTFKIYSRLGAQAEYGVDVRLREIAEEQNIEVVALESGEIQGKLFGSLPDEVKVEMLRISIADAGELEQQGRDFLNAWRRGDEAGFAGRLFDRTDEIPELFELLHATRNARWTDQIEEMVADGKPTFVAVGGAHLFGDEGLLERFRERGWTVKRIDRKGLPEVGEGA